MQLTLDSAKAQLLKGRLQCLRLPPLVWALDQLGLSKQDFYLISQQQLFLAGRQIYIQHQQIKQYISIKKKRLQLRRVRLIEELVQKAGQWQSKQNKQEFKLSVMVERKQVIERFKSEHYRRNFNIKRKKDLDQHKMQLTQQSFNKLKAKLSQAQDKVNRSPYKQYLQKRSLTYDRNRNIRIKRLKRRYRIQQEQAKSQLGYHQQLIDKARTFRQKHLLQISKNSACHQEQVRSKKALSQRIKDEIIKERRNNFVSSEINKEIKLKLHFQSLNRKLQKKKLENLTERIQHQIRIDRIKKSPVRKCNRLKNFDLFKRYQTDRQMISEKSFFSNKLQLNRLKKQKIKEEAQLIMLQRKKEIQNSLVEAQQNRKALMRTQKTQMIVKRVQYQVNLLKTVRAKRLKNRAVERMRQEFQISQRKREAIIQQKQQFLKEMKILSENN